MAFTTTVKITGIREAEQKLDNIEGYIKNPSKILKKAILFFKDDTEGEVFNSEGRSIGKGWSRLSPSYAKVKARKYPGKGILEATGKMRRSFKTSVGKTRAVLSNSSPIFKYHQLGTRKMPQRVVLYIDRKREEKVLDMFQKEANKVINK